MLFKGENHFANKYQKWYQVSFLRFSTRVFYPEAIELKHRKAIDALAEQINKWDEGIKIIPVYDIKPDMFESFGYTRLKAVPAFLAIFTTAKKVKKVKAGYYGEAMCLALTSMDIKTCWVSGSIKKRALKDYINISKGERFLTSIAFGYAQDKTQAQVLKRLHRKPLQDVYVADKQDAAMEKIMACAANAPSAINRQPWRYALAKGVLTVKNSPVKGGPFPAQLDIGISMMHVSCAANALNTQGNWQAQKGVLAAFKR